MKNRIITTLELCRGWLDPFNYPRATYESHWRVRTAWWARFMLGALLAGFGGYLLAVGAAAITLLSIQYGIPHMGAADIIGRLAAVMCLSNQAMCHSNAYIPTMGSTAIIAIAIGWVIWIVSPGSAPKPAAVTDHDLTELRMLGYIILEEEEIDDGQCAVGAAGAGAGADSIQPGKLDQACVVSGGSCAPAEIPGGAAS